MYIKITGDIIDKVYEKNQQCIQLIKLLDWTIIQGKHLVFGEKKDLDRIIGLKLGVEFNGFKYVLSQYSIIGSMVNKLKWHAEFSLTKQSYRDNEHKTIYIKIDDLPQFDVYKETHLLCENLNDIYFYEYVLDFYKKTQQIDVTNKYYPILGGGSTTHKVYESEILKRNAFVVCIADSDKKSPKGALGETAKAIERVDTKEKPFNAIFYHLQNVTEVENLIPIDIYAKYIYTNTADEQRQKLETITDLGNIDIQFLDFFDMKKGIAIKNILTDDENAKYQKTIAKSIHADVEEICDKNNQCIEEIMKAISDIEGVKNMKIDIDKYVKASGVLVCGLGDNILEHILKFQTDDLEKLHTNSPNSIRLSQSEEYKNIGELLCDWTCCLNEVRS